MPNTNEVAFNGQLAEVLRGKHPLWGNNLIAEQTGVIRGNPRLQPDILVLPPNAQPVSVETEYVPASTVEDDARARLGLIPLNSSDPIEQAIALRIPASLRHNQSNLIERISQADFEYCVLSSDSSSHLRWPEKGWLTGGVDDIVRCIEYAMVSQRLVDQSILILEFGVRAATQVIKDAVELGFVDIESEMGRVLNQHSGEQTNRMAMTIIANALTFQSTIAGTHEIPSVAQLRVKSSGSIQNSILDTWQRILDEINYWPIFKVASDLLAPIRAATANSILDTLISASDQLANIGVTSRHDLSGRMFQKLIADRKFLATFYTLPSSATLLAEIAVGRLNADWNKLDDYPNLTIADLSCGTGTLLSAAYHTLLTRYRHAGGDDRNVHKRMIENSVIAADIMPAAAHLCASQLSSVHPTVTFENTRVYTLPYGIGSGDERFSDIAIGSLDLIATGQSSSLFPTGQQQARGAQSDIEVRDVALPHKSVDLVIMNPPFTRPTNHEIANVPVPSFAGFETTDNEQHMMSERLKRIRQGIDNPAGNGNAGLASNFIDLAHAKVKPGGTIALILPITSLQSTSWQAARNMLANQYENIAVVTIANAGSLERAFSADTSIAETLIVATKMLHINEPEANVLFVNLHHRPSNLLEATVVAKLVERLPPTSTVGRIRAGNQMLGSYIRAPISEGGCAAVRESALVDTMIALRGGELRLLQLHNHPAIPITSLGQLGVRGLMHRDIGEKIDGGRRSRGPFSIYPIEGIPDYPILWGHDANRERHMLVQPDSKGDVHTGCKEKAVTVWQSATRLHFTLDFRLNSQSLAACLTPEPTLGGRAWPNFRLNNDWEEIITLWANCTLGLMAFWWLGARAQQGKAVLTISKLPNLMVLDPRRLSAERLDHAKTIFERFENSTFLPANEAYRDEVRKSLDRAVLVELLQLPEDVLTPLETLRLQWANEPTVHGGKSTSP